MQAILETAETFDCPKRRCTFCEVPCYAGSDFNTSVRRADKQRQIAADTRSNPRAGPPPPKRVKAQPNPALRAKAKPARVHAPTAPQQAKLAKLTEKIDGLAARGKTLLEASNANANFPASLRAAMNVRLQLLGSARADIDMLVNEPSAATKGYAHVRKDGHSACASVDDQIERFLAQNKLLQESD